MELEHKEGVMSQIFPIASILALSTHLYTGRIDFPNVLETLFTHSAHEHSIAPVVRSLQPYIVVSLIGSQDRRARTRL